MTDENKTTLTPGNEEGQQTEQPAGMKRGSPAGDPGSIAAGADKSTQAAADDPGEPDAGRQPARDPGADDILKDVNDETRQKMQEAAEATRKLYRELYASHAEILQPTIKEAANGLFSAAVKENAQTLADTANRLIKNMGANSFDFSALVPPIDMDLTGMSEALNKTFGTSMRPLLDKFEPVFELNKELEKLAPYLQKELKKPEYEEALLFMRHELQNPDYSELHIEDIIDYEFPTISALLQAMAEPEPPKDSLTFKALAAARAAAEADRKRQQSREARKEAKQNAQDGGAVMQLQGGIIPYFSSDILMDAFTPERIHKIGTLNRNYIDSETGLVKKTKFEPGELEDVTAREISLKAFTLLNAITKNTVSNVREYYVKGGKIEFYVKGVLQAFTDDPRTLYDDQLNLDMKTAGVLYIENLLKPLLEYVGDIPHGGDLCSHYTVFSYYGYNALKDTMIIETPYLYQLWKLTQGAYFDRQKRITEARANNKKPAKTDFKPLEVNEYFKGKAFTANETTLEIAVYITTVLLNAGCKKGERKTTKIAYKTIIENCARFNERLTEIAERPNVEIQPDGKKINNANRYNAELKKITSAFDMILDAERCSITDAIAFDSIQPSKNIKGGRLQILAPTKSRLNENIVIEWRRK